MEDLKRNQWTWTKFNDLGLQEFQALIVDYERKTVLLKRDEGRWVMPAYVGDGANYESSFLPEFVKEKTQKEIEASLDLCVLRQVWREEMSIDRANEGFTFEKAVVLVQCFESEEGDGVRKETDVRKEDSLRKENEKGYAWVSLARAKVFHLFTDPQKIIAAEIERIIRNRVPEKRLTWQRPGWLESATSWMKDVLLRERDAHVVKPVIVERSTPLGTVVVAETTKGKFFLKCTPPWQNDAGYTAVLSRMVPKYVAAPVAVDVKEQVMITSDYGEILVPVTFDDKDLTKLTRDFVKLQQEAIGRVDELVSEGMPDFRAEALLKRMEWVAGHTMLDTVAEDTEYGEAVLFFRKNLGKMKGKVEELYCNGIPSTVTHNDLLLSNVYKREGCESFMFFDWVQGYVAHPFTGDTDPFTTNEYLRGWEEYGSVEQLREWCRAGQKVRMIIECILWMVEAENTEEPEAREAFGKAAEGVNDVFVSFRKVL